MTSSIIYICKHEQLSGQRDRNRPPLLLKRTIASQITNTVYFHFQRPRTDSLALEKKQDIS